MSQIIVPCHRCGRQVPSSDLRDGICLDCRVTEALADLRAEHLRLWRKRERYLAQGANAESISRQVGRVEDRMAERIRGMVSDEPRAAELLQRELEEARQARYRIGGR